MNEPHSFLVAIHKSCNLTWKRYQALKSFFKGDFEAAFLAKSSDWESAGVDKKAIENFFSASVNLGEEMEKLNRIGAKVLVHGDEDYPLSLLHIPQPPVLLFARGKIKLDDFPALGVVGSRKITDYGKTALEALLTPVINQGVTTISGLALGTDQKVHELSLLKNQRTLAVLGNGIDHIYPQSNRILADKILENGAIISEYLPGVQARPEYFPQRNRIVSGLSKAVVLVEAAEKSGTLITAAWANEQGRDIFSIPGNIFSAQSKGTNQLIAQGLATALVNAEQLQVLYANSVKAEALDLEAASDIDEAILACLAKESPLHGDELIRQLDFPPPVVSSHLMLLEVRGWIKDVGQQMYSRSL